MVIFCRVLGIFTFLMGALTWMLKPILEADEDGSLTLGFMNQTLSMLSPFYILIAIAFVIGGFFWFAIAKVISNQESILYYSKQAAKMNDGFLRK